MSPYRESLTWISCWDTWDAAVEGGNGCHIKFKWQKNVENTNYSLQQENLHSEIVVIIGNYATQKQLISQLILTHDRGSKILQTLIYGRDRGMGDMKGEGGKLEDPPLFGLFLSGVNSFRLDELTLPPLSGVSGISPIFPV